ncbi:MAG: DUF799 domain-containing protein [Treponema sp.]|nr:DUF799 domain-containing protein [Treponema sp.]
MRRIVRLVFKMRFSAAGGLALVTGLFLLGSCASTVNYTAFKESRPRSILILPPINKSPDIRAQAAFLASSSQPIAESGFYVIPPGLSAEMFKQNGMTVAEDAQAIPYDKLYEIFGADAGLYITVTRFGPSFIGIDSRQEAAADAKLIDLRTGKEIWAGEVFVQLGNRAVVGTGGLLGLVVNAAVNQVVNSLSDRSMEAASAANNKLLPAGTGTGFLYGPYHPKYGTD